MNKKAEHTFGDADFPMNLTRFLSTAGAASRRKSAELIKDGRVAVNGRTVIEPGTKVNQEDIVALDGEVLSHCRRYYIMLNKPCGYTCTSDDPFADKKAIDLVDLPEVRLFSVGRLDKNSEGMLIFTNDGNYAAVLTHPRHEIFKEYEVETDTPIPPEFFKKYLDGISDAGETLRARAFAALDQKCCYKVILNEGKKREIRRMVNAAGCKTIRLKRIATGRLQMGNLASGKWRFLTPEEVEASTADK